MKLTDMERRSKMREFGATFAPHRGRVRRNPVVLRNRRGSAEDRRRRADATRRQWARWRESQVAEFMQAFPTDTQLLCQDADQPIADDELLPVKDAYADVLPCRYRDPMTYICRYKTRGLQCPGLEDVRCKPWDAAVCHIPRRAVGALLDAVTV